MPWPWVRARNMPRMRMRMTTTTTTMPRRVLDMTIDMKVMCTTDTT
eukprot:CAMPEP_0119201550 /NCGR_PEP_ID=MMETSP1316-20130426/29471_1 /TAXON_ID=41880 /ORGANISM="Pycnococcus provasolii, Strain RCC2336" /LENGTH=45 /DNA_ID= /DNA_START= /DNA_END= /DNA_ORIENTATION=